MVSPLLHGLTEEPMSFEASLSSSPQTSSTTASIFGEGTVSSNSRGCSLGIVLPTTSSLGDNPVTVRDSIQGLVMNSNPLTLGSKSYADLLRAPQASVQSFPMTSPPSKKGGFVSIRVDPIAYQSRLELCKDALIWRVVLASGECHWKLVNLKAKLNKHWLISADWRLISLGKGYFQIILKSSRDKNKVWGLGSVNLKPGVLRLQPWVLDFNRSLQKSTKAQVCNVLPRKVPPPSSAVVSSGSYVMEAISLGIPSQSLGVGVSVTSFGPTIQDDRRIVRDVINPSRDMRSESSLSNSQAELHFLADSSWAK
ncbi:hypothetical protein Dsin_012408 [Dipteronia sinensis]|uniref:DUF4283 domain-containing protein n=1 Tax=Dipteronia sinensis TaxID=43782 RepID=A0AAE0E7X5_9ROSI|nr:hypothetical protein Dsin_012408 [Dipteronia sinensis]